MRLLHGTSSSLLEKIQKEGLHEPFLTDQEELARYYAQEACDTAGGNPVILEVDADPGSLRYDGNSMDEPVSYGGKSIAEIEKHVKAAWQKAAREHPEWKHGGHIVIPETEWRISLRTVGSVLCAGRISPEKLIIQRAD